MVVFVCILGFVMRFLLKWVVRVNCYLVDEVRKMYCVGDFFGDEDFWFIFILMEGLKV